MNPEKIEEKVKNSDLDHCKGYNCCQSVVCAFAEELKEEKETLFAMSEGFGLGMGMMGTCGAVTGMFMLAGLVNSARDLNNGRSKPATMAIIREMTEEFTKRCGSTTCRELKGVDTGVMLASCPDCITTGIRIAAEKLWP